MRDDDLSTPADEEIRAAEQTAPDHHHDGPSYHGSLAEHLRGAHGVEASDSLSDATLEGLHDRIYHRRHASER
jgi:hypothetical protein